MLIQKKQLFDWEKCMSIQKKYRSIREQIVCIWEQFMCIREQYVAIWEKCMLIRGKCASTPGKYVYSSKYMSNEKNVGLLEKMYLYSRKVYVDLRKHICFVENNVCVLGENKCRNISFFKSSGCRTRPLETSGYRPRLNYSWCKSESTLVLS